MNEEDIQEVENWYPRKYPKLVEAQRRRAEEKNKPLKVLLKILNKHNRINEKREETDD